jgi:hypothetical protein
MSRKVTLYIDEATYTHLTERFGYQAYYNAVGYLSSWSHGSGNYPVVEIYGTSEELYAHYITADQNHSKVGYTIAAIGHEAEDDNPARFSFHS